MSTELNYNKIYKDETKEYAGVQYNTIDEGKDSVRREVNTEASISTCYAMVVLFLSHCLLQGKGKSLRTTRSCSGDAGIPGCALLLALKIGKSQIKQQMLHQRAERSNGFYFHRFSLSHAARSSSVEFHGQGKAL